MEPYNLTDGQKNLLRNLVALARAGELGKDFFAHEQQDPKRAGAFICWIDLANGESFSISSAMDLNWLCEHSPRLVFRTNKAYSITQAGIEAVDSDFTERILLELSQEELLCRVVEATRNVPFEKRGKFMVAQSTAGDSLIFPGLSGAKRKIYFGDVEALAREGLLALGYSSRGSPHFDITPRGFRHYEYLNRRTGDAVSRIDSTIRRHLDSEGFRRSYPKAHEKWASAEKLLWQSDSQKQLTTTGHLCREAAQEFATALVERFSPPDVTEDKTKTILRVRAVLDSRGQNMGRTQRKLLNAMLEYWRAVNDLIQRQEHGALKEGEQLVWQDARRVVFHTAIVMFEIDEAVGG